MRMNAKNAQVWIGAVKVADLGECTITSTQPINEDSAAEDAAQTYNLGRPQWRVRFSKNSTTAQLMAVMNAAYAQAVDTTGRLYRIVCYANPSLKVFEGVGNFVDAEVAMPNASNITSTAEFVIHGLPTFVYTSQTYPTA